MTWKSGGCWLFAPWIRALLDSPTVGQLDLWAATALHGIATPTLTVGFLLLSQVHGTLGILVMTLLAAALLWRHGGRRAGPVLRTMVAVVPVGMLVNGLVKLTIHRNRPQWTYSIPAPESFSFPSGHTAGATLFYGLLLVWLWPRVRAVATRGAFAVGAMAMVLLVGASRIVLAICLARARTAAPKESRAP